MLKKVVDGVGDFFLSFFFDLLGILKSFMRKKAELAIDPFLLNLLLHLPI